MGKIISNKPISFYVYLNSVIGFYGLPYPDDNEERRIFLEASNVKTHVQARRWLTKYGFSRLKDYPVVNTDEALCDNDKWFALVRDYSGNLKLYELNEKGVIGVTKHWVDFCARYKASSISMHDVERYLHKDIVFGKWLNLGDNNYLAYGGCLVRPKYSEVQLSEYDAETKEILKNEYEVFNLITEAGQDGKTLSAALYTININDLTQEDIDSIMELCGYDSYVGLGISDIINEGHLSKETLVKEAVECLNGGHAGTYECYKNPYPCDFKDTFISIKNLKKWLKSLGAEEYI